MTKYQFIRFVKNKAARGHITNIAMEKDGKITPLKSINIDWKNKRLYFNITEEKGNPYVKVHEITDFERLSHSIDGYQWSFIIQTKSDEIIRLHMSMDDGYSPFCYDEFEKKNYADVMKAIPKYLDKYKGKTVIVNHATKSDTFLTFSEETDGSALPIADSYIIHDFDYKIYTMEGLPCVKMICKDNENTYACALGISLVSENTLYCADGEHYLRIME